MQGLAPNTVHEFAIVSHDHATAKQVTGPWLPVPIGDISTEEIQRRVREASERDYRAHEDAHREAERLSREESEQRARDHQEALNEQQRQADIDNARRERERLERERIHREAVAELHKVAPRDLSFRLRDLGSAGMVCDIRFRRGSKAPDFYQFKVAGTVLGYHPDGRHSGRKSSSHIYERTVQVPRGQKVEIHVYGVTKHGDAGNPVTLPVPQSLCDPPADNPDRMARIVAACIAFTGRRTRSGKPYLRDLRRASGIADITRKERNAAHRNATA